MAAPVALLEASLEAIGEPQGSGLVSRLHEKLVFIEKHQKHMVKPPFSPPGPHKGQQGAPVEAPLGVPEAPRGSRMPLMVPKGSQNAA